MVVNGYNQELYTCDLDQAISKPVAEAMGPSVFVIFIFFGVSEDAFTNKYSNFNSNIAIFVEQDSWGSVDAKNGLTCSNLITESQAYSWFDLYDLVIQLENIPLEHFSYRKFRLEVWMMVLYILVFIMLIRAKGSSIMTKKLAINT